LLLLAGLQESVQPIEAVMDLSHLRLPSAMAHGLNLNTWTSVTSSTMLKLNKDNHHHILRCLTRAVPKCQRCAAVMFPFGWAQKGEDSCHCTSCLPKDLQAALQTSLTRRSQPLTKSMPDPPKQLYVVLLTKPEAL
jgi:tRNA(Ile2) C34 agmatinyltransferase TiaS